MVDDIGPEGIRERVEARLGRKLEDYTLPPIDGRAVAPHGRARAEAGRPLLHRRAGPPRPDLGRPDDRDRRSGRALRRRHPADAPAELHRHRRPERVGRRGGRRARAHRLPARHQPGARQLDRLHRRAALQLLGRRDEDAPRPADRPPRGDASATRSPTCGCTSTAARTPAPSTGSATSASRARPSRDEGGVRRQAYDIFVRGSLGPEPADRRVALPARADRRARRRRRGPDRRLARRSASRGETLHGVLAPPDRRRAWRAGRPRAGEEDEQREEVEA